MNKISRRGRMLGLSLSVALALGACVTPAPNVEPAHVLSGSSGKGVAVGTIVSLGVHGHYRLYYRQIGGGEAGFFQLSSVDPSQNGAIFATELAAGDYEIYDWRIYLHSPGAYAWREISTPGPVSIPFHVSPGESVYVGSCAFGLNLGRRGAVQRVIVECARRPERDIALLQERYPGLSPIANSASSELLYSSQRFRVRRYSPEGYVSRI